MEMNEPTQEKRVISAHEFAIVEGTALWGKLQKPVNIDANALIIAASLLTVAACVGEGCKLIAARLPGVKL
jgi:hypothetical protein